MPLVPRSRTVVIVDVAHRGHLAASGLPGSLRAVVVQPEDRGTAAGVLLALTPVLETAPDAVVVITPSDHGVMDDARFRRGVLDAVRHVRSRGDIVLFGVRPAAPHQDYGWISVGAACSVNGLRPVRSFVEKPGPDLAASLFASGAVWNTMVIVARAAAIRDLYVELLPDLARVFGVALRLSELAREVFLAGVYPTLPAYDFSRDVLTRARRLSAFVWPASIGWSDLGTPERVHEWHRAQLPRPIARTISAA